MTLDDLNISGIYMLKWDNDTFYIGKSVNVRERILQHINSFYNSTAAIKLQGAYDVYGIPSVSLLLECHADNIDVMEAYFIGALKSDLMLNTVMMSNPLIDKNDVLIDKILDDYCQLSLADLSERLNGLEVRNNLYSMEVSDLYEQVKDLSYKRSAEEIEADKYNLIDSLKYELKELSLDFKGLETEKESLEQELKHLTNLPWYKRLFIKPR